MFEHKFIFLSASDLLGEENDTVQSLGLNRWELVSLTPTKVFGKDGKFILAFKREKVLEQTD